MKINPIQGNGYIQNRYNTARVNIPQKERVLPSSDEVSFSREALSFSKTLSDIKEQIETRSGRELSQIDDIKSRVQQGTYAVDSGLVAQSIIRMLSE